MKRSRAAVALIGCALVSSSTWTADTHGQTPPPIQAPVPQQPSVAGIVVQQADVYSGPGTGYYATARLRYNDRVILLGNSKKAPGWVEILPPPGSFSWIDAKFVKVVPGFEKIGIVDAGDSKATAPVMVGSAVVNKEPSVEIARVATGTQIMLLDRPTTSGSTSWYPIAPTATEVRFLPAEAVRGGTYAGNTFGGAVPTSWQTPSATPPTSGWQPTAGPAGNPAATAAQQFPFIALSQQGDQALAAGDVDRARLLYTDALRQTTDPRWQGYLNNQLAKLSTGTGTVPAPPVQTASSPAPVQPAPIPSWNPNPAAPPGPTPMPAPAAQKKWSEWGVLRGTTVISQDGLPMYVLVNMKTGAPIIYVTTNAGMSLREYVGQTVTIYGSIATRQDASINMQYLIAEQVQTPPPGSGR
jgi:hypothetical protein